MFFSAALANTVAALNVAYLSKCASVTLPTNVYILTILQRLKDINIIKSYNVIYSNHFKKYVKIDLLYIDGQPVIKKLIVLSKGSIKYTIAAKQLNILLFTNWRDTYILTTSKGILTEKEAAVKKIGGFLLLKIIY